MTRIQTLEKCNPMASRCDIDYSPAHPYSPHRAGKGEVKVKTQSWRREENTVLQRKYLNQRSEWEERLLFDQQILHNHRRCCLCVDLPFVNGPQCPKQSETGSWWTQEGGGGGGGQKSIDRNNGIHCLCLVTVGPAPGRVS